MPAHESALLDLVRDAYACAENPARWPNFLHAVREITGAVAAGIFVQDLGSRSGSLVVQVGGDESAVRRYHEHFASVNPWFTGSGPSQGPGAITRGLDPESFLGTEYHEDFWRRYGLGSTLTAYLGREGMRVEGLMVVREAGAPAFEPGAHDALSRLAPWLEQSLRLSRRLSSAVSVRAALSDVIERLRYGIVVVGGDRKVVLTNSCAREVLREKDGLCLVQEELVASGRCRGESLGHLIEDAVLAGRGVGMSPGGATLVERERSDWPLALLVCPLTQAGGQRDAPAALVVISDEGSRARPIPALLQDLYSLTPAEARVAVGVAQGRTLEALAAGADASRETVRKQLKTVFDKTGTHKQSELASLLLSGVAVMGTPGPVSRGDEEDR